MDTDSKIGSDRADGSGPERWRPEPARIAIWLLVAAATTAGLWLLRDSLDKAHVALAFLLVVLAGSARDGRLVGLLLALTCFLTFNFFLLPPLYALHLEDPLDWAVLAAFLVTGGVAAELLHRQRFAARRAERRAIEMDRLAGLVAESLSVGRATEAVAAITHVVRAELGVEVCEIFDVESGGRMGGGETDAPAHLAPLVARAVRERRCVLVGPEREPRVAPRGTPLAEVLSAEDELRDVFLPLRVRQRTLGVLWLSDRRRVRVEPERARFAEALAYYAALAAERVHLEAEAERVEALREADRLKDALLATVSHDLRTPLTTIRAAAGDLTTAGLEQGELIEREADRLNTLVTDLLDLSRLRAGKLPLSLEVNAAEDLVGAALQRLAGLPGAESIVVTLPVDATIPLGRFDFVHSLRALTNLVENALRHSPRPGSVGIRVERVAEELLFRVLDEGPGVADADLPHLFEPFFRSSSNGTVRGTGLGLAIARGVAEAHGGAVHYSGREGGGSVFTLRLPAADLETDFAAS